MRILVAGATGALGSPIMRELASSGHEVFGLTRSPGKGERVRAAGGTPVVGDVFDVRRMGEVFHQVRPQGVIQVLNQLPKRGPLRPRDLTATNELRVKGTRNLLAAAVETGTRRYAVESMIFGYGYGVHPEPVGEDQPLARRAVYPRVQSALDALNDMEERVRSATEGGAIEGVILRYGFFYGPGVGSTEFMASLLRKRLFGLPGGGRAVGSWIHVEDGARAAVTALESAPAGAVYNVVDDRPTSWGVFARAMAEALDLPKPYDLPMWTAHAAGRYLALMMRSSLPVSNRKIRAELGWEPRYPTVREGLASVRARIL